MKKWDIISIYSIWIKTDDSSIISSIHNYLTITLQTLLSDNYKYYSERQFYTTNINRDADAVVEEHPNPDNFRNHFVTNVNSFKNE